MASAAMLRSAGRSLGLRLRQPLEAERWCLLARQFLSSSSSVPAERHTCSASSSKPLEGSVSYEEPENYKQLLMTADQILEALEERSRLLKELEVQIKENKPIDLTPWIVSLSSSFLLFGLYKYMN